MDLFFLELLYGVGSKYKQYGLYVVFGLFVMSVLFLYPFFELWGVLYSFFIGLIIYLVYLFLPKLVEKTFIGHLEKELPYFLMGLDISLFLNVDFQTAIKKNAKKYYYVNVVFNGLFINYLRGGTIENSFFRLGEKINSVSLKRSLGQLLVIYNSGYKENLLTTLSLELLDKQRLDAKAYSSKLVMYSLFFIAATAILPALYLMFITVGSTIMETSVNSTQLYLLFFLLFPLVDMGFIFFVYYQMPKHLRKD